MAVKIKLENDTGANDLRTSDFGLIGRGGEDDGAVFLRIKDIETGDVVRTVLPADPIGQFAFSPAGYDDGRYMVRVKDPSNGDTDNFRVKLDTTADDGNGFTMKIFDGGDGVVNDPGKTFFKVTGLDGDARALITFTDADGDTVTKWVGSNDEFRVDLSSLNGAVTSSVTITDGAENSTVLTGDDTVICFFPGTAIATPAGDVAVEALAAGDLVLTTEGEARPVVWVGRQTVSTRFGDASRVLPIRIGAGALAANLPLRDLLVSPDHALLIDGVLVQAAALVNGTTIRREAAVPTVFTYYHVELADHALILAEGVPAETFIDNAGRLAFDNWHEHAALRPEGVTIAELPLPRAKSARQVPAAARARIAAQVLALTPAVATAA